MTHKRSTALERSVKYFTDWLKPVLQRANLTLSSDVGQDTYMFGLREPPLSYSLSLNDNRWMDGQTC